MVRNSLVTQMPDARDQRVMVVSLCPVDSFFLGFSSVEDTIGVVLNDEVRDRASLAPFRTRFNVHIRHVRFSLCAAYERRENCTKIKPWVGL
jgi:hypothetical protein